MRGISGRRMKGKKGEKREREGREGKEGREGNEGEKCGRRERRGIERRGKDRIWQSRLESYTLNKVVCC